MLHFKGGRGSLGLVMQLKRVYENLDKFGLLFQKMMKYLVFGELDAVMAIPLFSLLWISPSPTSGLVIRPGTNSRS